MFIRASSQKDKKTDRVYTTYRLVESYRNQDGKVRQQTLLNLGCHFKISKNHWKHLADRIEEIQRGQKSLFELDVVLEKEAQRITKVISKKNDIILKKSERSVPLQVETDFQTLDINSLDHRDIRQIGAEHVGYHAACQLEISTILRSLNFNQKKIDVALATIIGRLIHPGSDLKTHRYLRENSALDDLLETDFSTLSLKKFYQIADELYKNKESIEKALYKREKNLFNLKEVVTLYDITNTYFEGRCLSHSKAHYGRSKEKRTDCPLVSLGLVLDASGFPKKSKIFPGNVSEPQTLKEMLSVLKTQEKSIIVMDAGIATEANIEWLCQEGYEYIVVSRKRHLVQPEVSESLIVKDDKNNVVQVSLHHNEKTKELELYCHSQAKEAKSTQMISKAESRYEEELQKLADGLLKKGSLKKYDKIIERLGRLKEKYKKVGKYYNVTVTPDDQKSYAVSVVWEKSDKSDEDQRGIYCLRTNKIDLDALTFWKTYTMLTDLESAFRSLKSELGFRPVYHQKESRIDAHLFISLLAYHLLHTLRYQLKKHNIHESWQRLRDILKTQCRITSRFNLENGDVLHLRKTSSPDANQQKIYQALGITSHPGKTEKACF